VARLVLDSSVLIAYFSPADEHHERATSTLAAALADERIVIASVLAEILVHPYRVGPAAVARVESALAALLTRVEPVTDPVARRAADLRARHGSLRLGDALVIAAGDVLNARVLTADRSWAKLSSRIRVL
jgi:PIN domain nuclease of toxin-antitoxin system